MLIYEKNNKLNINFDNEVSEQPDLQIGKNGDKTEVLIDGQESGGSGGVFVVHDNDGTLDKTYAELDAISKNKIILLYDRDVDTATLWFGNHFYYSEKQDNYVIEFRNLADFNTQAYFATSTTDYPSKS